MRRKPRFKVDEVVHLDDQLRKIKKVQWCQPEEAFEVKIGNIWYSENCPWLHPLTDREARRD